MSIIFGFGVALFSPLAPGFIPCIGGRGVHKWCIAFAVKIVPDEGLNNHCVLIFFLILYALA